MTDNNNQKKSSLSLASKPIGIGTNKGFSIQSYLPKDHPYETFFNSKLSDNPIDEITPHQKQTSKVIYAKSNSSYIKDVSLDGVYLDKVFTVQ